MHPMNLIFVDWVLYTNKQICNQLENVSKLQDSHFIFISLQDFYFIHESINIDG